MWVVVLPSCSNYVYRGKASSLQLAMGDGAAVYIWEHVDSLALIKCARDGSYLHKRLLEIAEVFQLIHVVIIVLIPKKAFFVRHRKGRDLLPCATHNAHAKFRVFSVGSIIYICAYFELDGNRTTRSVASDMLVHHGE